MRAVSLDALALGFFLLLAVCTPIARRIEHRRTRRENAEMKRHLKNVALIILCGLGFGPLFMVLMFGGAQ